MSQPTDTPIQPPKVRTSNRPSKKTPEFCTRFLEALQRNDGFVSMTCMELNVAHKTVYNWKHEDADFCAAWDAVIQNSLDVLEREGYRRAHQGQEEDVWYQGQIVGSKVNKSDALLMWYINNKRGYTQKSDHRVGGLPGAPLLNGAAPAFEFYPENFTDEQARTFAELLDIAQRKPLPKDNPPAITAPQQEDAVTDDI